MKPRRFFIAALLSMASAAAVGQSAGGPFRTWKGEVPGIGEATLIIAAVGADGRVKGQMEFALQGFVSTFADKADPVKRTNQGIVSDGTLTIETALGEDTSCGARVTS
jgi:hypothetical protein